MTTVTRLSEALEVMHLNRNAINRAIIHELEIVLNDERFANQGLPFNERLKRIMEKGIYSNSLSEKTGLSNTTS